MLPIFSHFLQCEDFWYKNFIQVTSKAIIAEILMWRKRGHNSLLVILSQRLLVSTQHEIICFGTRFIILLEKAVRAVAVGQVFKNCIGVCVTYGCGFIVSGKQMEPVTPLALSVSHTPHLMSRNDTS